MAGNNQTVIHAYWYMQAHTGICMQIRSFHILLLMTYSGQWSCDNDCLVSICMYLFPQRGLLAGSVRNRPLWRIT